jgi:hypothetical protein
LLFVTYHQLPESPNLGGLERPGETPGPPPESILDFSFIGHCILVIVSSLYSFKTSLLLGT